MDVILVPLLGVFQAIINLYKWIVIIHIIMSWLVSFGIINTSSNFVMMVNNFLHSATEPVLEKLRKFLPSFSGLDFSPLVLILALVFLSNVIARFAAKFV